MTDQEINWPDAISDIVSKFSNDGIIGEKRFDEKLTEQFDAAEKNTKLAFSNIEYLWALAVSDLTRKKKREYAVRWITIADNKNNIFIDGHDCIGNSGEWHRRNKYHEICALIKLFKFLKATQIKDINAAYELIEKISFSAIYDKTNPIYADYFEPNKCCMYNVLLHLANPKKYEAILADGDKERIVNYFTHKIYRDDRHAYYAPYIKRLQNLKLKEADNREAKINTIRLCLLDLAENDIQGRKERWFFYGPIIKGLWKPKSMEREKALSDKLENDSAQERNYLEGREVLIEGKRVRVRNPEVVCEVKRQDNYTCQICQFHYENMIVEAHHLKPFNSSQGLVSIRKEDLITLCPNCHRIGHRLLKSEKYVKRENLVAGIQEILRNIK